MWSFDKLKLPLTRPVKGGSTVVAAAVALGGIVVLAHPLHSSQDALAGSAASLAESLEAQTVLAKNLVSEPLPEPLPGAGPDVRETVTDVLDAFESALDEDVARCTQGLEGCVDAGGCVGPADAPDGSCTGATCAPADAAACPATADDAVSGACPADPAADGEGSPRACEGGPGTCAPAPASDGGSSTSRP